MEWPPPPGQASAPAGQYPYADPYLSNSQYPYPYTGGFPEVRPGDVRPRRPGVMHLALVLFILSAVVPGLTAALLVVLVTGAASDPTLASAVDDLSRQLNTSVEQGLTYFRVAAGIIAALAISYIVFAVVAWRGRNWARIAITVLTGLFDLVLVLGLVGGAVGGGVYPTTGLVAASVLGVVLLYLRPSSEYFARQAKG
jgi:hypothetical protein